MCIHNTEDLVYVQCRIDTSLVPVSDMLEYDQQNLVFDLCMVLNNNPRSKSNNTGEKCAVSYLMLMSNTSDLRTFI